MTDTDAESLNLRKFDDGDRKTDDGYKQTGSGKQMVIHDGHKPIPDPESPELEITTDTEPEQPYCFRSDEDPKSPDLEMSSDTEPEQPFCLISDDGVRRFSDLHEMLNFISKSDNQTDGDNQTDDGNQTDCGLRKMEDSDVHIYDGHKPIPDPESPELDMASDTEPEQPHSFLSDDDPESPELEMSSDTEPEQPFCLISDDGVMRFSHLHEMLNFISKESDNQIDGDNQIDRGKQMVIDEGESQSSSTKSRKRKRTTPCCTCPQSPAKTEEPPLPEGYGYVPYAPCVDENDRYCPQFTNRIRYMCCSRCGVKGDHWPPFCRNPVNDLPGGASNRFSWKYYLRNFDLDEYLEKQRREAEVKAMNSKSDMSRKCIHCRNKTRAETEVSAFPVGYEKPKPDARKKVHEVKRILRPSRRASSHPPVSIRTVNTVQDFLIVLLTSPFYVVV